MKNYEDYLARLSAFGAAGQRAVAAADDAFLALTFDAPPDNGTRTSREAAIRAIPLASHQRQLVLTVLQAHGPLTREGIEQASGLSGNSVRPRVSELLTAGLVMELEEWSTTRSGRRAALLKAV